MIEPSSVGDAYVAAAPEDRRSELAKCRQWFLGQLPEGYEETCRSGLLYIVPRKMFPAGYHCDPKKPLAVAWLTLTKSGFSLHLMTVYGNTAAEAKIRAAYEGKGMRLDMGKACIRFDRFEELETVSIGAIIAADPPAVFLERYRTMLESRAR